MPKLVITVEVDITEKDSDLFTLKDDFAMDAQADFVKDSLRGTNNKIDWKLKGLNLVQLRRLINQYGDHKRRKEGGKED